MYFTITKCKTSCNLGTKESDRDTMHRTFYLLFKWIQIEWKLLSNVSSYKGTSTNWVSARKSLSWCIPRIPVTILNQVILLQLHFKMKINTIKSNGSGRAHYPTRVINSYCSTDSSKTSLDYPSLKTFHKTFYVL